MGKQPANSRSRCAKWQLVTKDSVSPIWARYFAFGNLFDESNIKSQIERTNDEDEAGPRDEMRVGSGDRRGASSMRLDG